MRPKPPTAFFQYNETTQSAAALRRIYILGFCTYLRRVLPPEQLPLTFQALYNQIDQAIEAVPQRAALLQWHISLAHSVEPLGGRIPRWMRIEFGIPDPPESYLPPNDPSHTRSKDYPDPDLDALD